MSEIAIKTYARQKIIYLYKYLEPVLIFLIVNIINTNEKNAKIPSIQSKIPLNN